MLLYGDTLTRCAQIAEIRVEGVGTDWRVWCVA